MKVRDLFERASPVLYHYTTAYAALDIVKNNRFQLSISTGSPSEAKLAPPGYDYFLSLTRTITGDYHRYASNGAVMFVLDGTWFDGRYPVKPVDYWERSWLFPQSDRTRESEDRVFSREPEMPANAIRAVHILLTVSQEHRSAQVRQLMIACKQRKLPVYLYQHEDAWRLLDTRYSFTPREAQNQLKGIQPAGYTSRSRNYLESWIELLHKKSIKELTKNADSLRYNLRYYGYKNDDHGLTTEISNARKPNSGPARNSAIEILTYMRQHGLKTPMEFKNMLADKWDKIADREAAEKKAK